MLVNDYVWELIVNVYVNSWKYRDYFLFYFKVYFYVKIGYLF